MMDTLIIPSPAAKANPEIAVFDRRAVKKLDSTRKTP